MLALLHGKLKHKGSICLRLQEAESGGMVGLVVMPEVERQNSLTVPCYHTVLARAMTSEVAPKILDRAYERSFPIPPLYITFWGSRCTIHHLHGWFSFCYIQSWIPYDRDAQTPTEAPNTLSQRPFDIISQRLLQPIRN